MADGSKLRKTFFDNTKNEITDYSGSFIYTKKGNLARRLDYITTADGRITNESGVLKYEYHLKDHLGNTRLAINEDLDLDPEKASWRNEVSNLFYYPFGISYDSKGANKDIRYKYNGKEHDNDNNLNWYHYGVRFYDPEIGRWHTMDPADELNSPYSYVGNDPVNYVDPDGAEMDDIKIRMDRTIEVQKIPGSKTDTYYLEIMPRMFLDVLTVNKNQFGLVNVPTQFQYELIMNNEVVKFGFSAHLSKQNRWANPIALGAIIGVAFKTGFTDISLGNFSRVDGSTTPKSATHINGKNFDSRMLSNDVISKPMIVNSKYLDKIRNPILINELKGWGWQSTISNRNQNGYITPGTTPDPRGNHYDHFHNQTFRPKVKYIK